MAAIAESGLPSRDALPVCLGPWHENPHRLVSFLVMWSFDGGRLARAMQFLAENADEWSGKSSVYFKQLTQQQQDFYRKNIDDVIAYCDEAGFPMTRIALTKAVAIIGNDWATLPMVGDVFTEARNRLRDEAGIHKLYRLSPEKVKYYENARAILGDGITAAFPSTRYDAEEAAKCYAVSRPTACVFHLMRVLETGLSVLAAKFGVSANHTNWHTIIEQVEKEIRNMSSDPNRPADWKDQQEFFSQAASHFMVMKDAWRNYTAHARGKYTEEEAEVLLGNVRAFMQRLATQLHE